jgi:hypothetical protein
MQAQSRESKNVSLLFAGIYAETRLHAIGRFSLGSETKQVPSSARIIQLPQSLGFYKSLAK